MKNCKNYWTEDVHQSWRQTELETKFDVKCKLKFWVLT